MKYTLLVIDPDKNYASSLSQYAKKSGLFYEASYSLNGEEGYNLISIIKPDVIILDALIPVLDGIGILRRLYNEGTEKRPLIIINTSSSLPGLLSAASKYGADYFMIKPQTYENICITACDLLKGIKNSISVPEKKTDIEGNITVFLKSLGMPAHLDGYKYMRSALLFTLNDPDMISPITKRLYPALAEKYNTTKSCIERAIRHAIEVSWRRGNKKIISDIFGYDRDNLISRPTNAEYIAMTTDEIRMILRKQ
ncbi:MAG: sporulation transcription factor Spo0A [Clostridia bacterium]|nr:sporulation transcription factor Spo0A [Clostridia bacterium]